MTTIFVRVADTRHIAGKGARRGSKTEYYLNKPLPGFAGNAVVFHSIKSGVSLTAKATGEQIAAFPAGTSPREAFAALDVIADVPTSETMATPFIAELTANAAPYGTPATSNPDHPVTVEVFNVLTRELLWTYATYAANAGMFARRATSGVDDGVRGILRAVVITEH